jgi:hypothetical protein
VPFGTTEATVYNWISQEKIDRSREVDGHSSKHALEHGVDELVGFAAAVDQGVPPGCDARAGRG